MRTHVADMDVERAAEASRQIWRLTMSSTRSRQRGPASSSIPTPTDRSQPRLYSPKRFTIIHLDSSRSHSSTFTVGSPSSTPKCAELDSQTVDQDRGGHRIYGLAVWTTCADSRHLTSESLIPDVGVLPPAGRYRALIRHSLDESMLLSIVVPLVESGKHHSSTSINILVRANADRRAAVCSRTLSRIEQSSVPS